MMKYLIYPCLMMLLNGGLNAEEQYFAVNLEVKLLCPVSNELIEVINAIPKNSENDNLNEWNEWSASCILNMKKVIELIESGKVGNANFYISALPQEQTN